MLNIPTAVRHAGVGPHSQVATHPTALTPAAVQEAVAEVCRLIPPMWDLANFVAVNPFVGFADRPLVEAARTVAEGLGAQLLPGIGFYRERWRAGAFGPSELVAAAQRHGYNPLALQQMLEGTVRMRLRDSGGTLTVAERHDHLHGTSWHDTMIRHAASWCAAYAQQGRQTSAGLYSFWREAALLDRSLEIEGLRGWRGWVAALPATPLQAIADLLERMEVPPAAQHAYLYRLLGGIYGWASLLRRDGWAAGDPTQGDLVDLLAIRICTDGAVAALAPGVGADMQGDSIPAAVEDEAVLAVFQEALEDGYASRLFAALAPAPSGERGPRPALQGVFCIDVRSEPMRRHLEAQSGAIETLGFAGFFGVSLDWRAEGGSSARCPVLLAPGVQVRSLADAAPAGKGMLKAIQSAPSAFPFVETLGLAYGIGLLGDALTWLNAPRTVEGDLPFTLDPDGQGGGIGLAARVDLAAGILKNMGLRDRFARLVLLCGHESRSENNPHAAGLDCGACGGHSGALNARIAAALLNDAAVRAALGSQGCVIPDDTWFVAAIHDTSVDTVTLLDAERIPASHAADRAEAERWLAAAGAAVRAERAADLGIGKQPAGLLDRLLRRRARDWSEVRPEWGLARNAAFIAARRARTAGANLEGRTFLHEYDWRTDPDSSILSLILSAPMVVASWINLQYFASTVDNQTFGAGSKALHNRVGALGVVLGNGGDLRTGLALQSVQSADGRWFHEPLRLQVVVEAPQERIATVLAAHPAVLNLVENGWVRLFALDPHSSSVARWAAGRGWERVAEAS